MVRKAWVLDTETKGTGAEMVPLEKVQKRRQPGHREPGAASERPWRRMGRMRPEAGDPEPEPRLPRRFKVVDVMTRRPLVEGAGLRETLELLARSRSVVDVTVYVLEDPPGRWRALTFGEQKSLWELRQRAADPPDRISA